MLQRQPEARDIVGHEHEADGEHHAGRRGDSEAREQPLRRPEAKARGPVGAHREDGHEHGHADKQEGEAKGVVLDPPLFSTDGIASRIITARTTTVPTAERLQPKKGACRGEVPGEGAPLAGSLSSSRMPRQYTLHSALAHRLAHRVERCGRR